MMLRERTRPEGCLSDLVFDRWFAGELSAEAVASAEAHVATCRRCRERRADLAEERRAFLAARPSPGKAARPGLRRLAPAAVVALSVAAVAVLSWRLAVRPGPVPEAMVRLKGGPNIGFFVQRAEVAVRGTEGAPVRPGDRVQFVYTSVEPTHLAIYSLDASGTASIFYPAEDMAARLPAGSDKPLSSAVELDPVLGPEKVFALFCSSGFPVARFQKLLAEHRTLEAPDGCRLDVLSWQKEQPP
jgi:hypothetical protein